MRVQCPSCSEPLNIVAEIVSAVVEEVRPTVKMSGWDPLAEPVWTVGELGLCGPLDEPAASA